MVDIYEIRDNRPDSRLCMQVTVDLYMRKRLNPTKGLYCVYTSANVTITPIYAPECAPSVFRKVDVYIPKGFLVGYEENILPLKYNGEPFGVDGVIVLCRNPWSLLHKRYVMCYDEDISEIEFPEAIEEWQVFYEPGRGIHYQTPDIYARSKNYVLSFNNENHTLNGWAGVYANHRMCCKAETENYLLHDVFRAAGDRLEEYEAIEYPDEP